MFLALPFVDTEGSQVTFRSEVRWLVFIVAIRIMKICLNLFLTSVSHVVGPGGGLWHR